MVLLARNECSQHHRHFICNNPILAGLDRASLSYRSRSGQRIAGVDSRWLPATRYAGPVFPGGLRVAQGPAGGEISRATFALGQVTDWLARRLSASHRHQDKPMAQGHGGLEARPIACAILQDAHKYAILQDEYGCAGRTRACRTPTGPLGSVSSGTHTRGIPTMDGRWPVGLHIEQDAHKGRPYYGRALGAWVHVTRILASGRSDGLVAGRGCSASVHPFAPRRHVRVVFTRNLCKRTNSRP